MEWMIYLMPRCLQSLWWPHIFIIHSVNFLFLFWTFSFWSVRYMVSIITLCWILKTSSIYQEYYYMENDDDDDDDERILSIIKTEIKFSWTFIRNKNKIYKKKINVLMWWLVVSSNMSEYSIVVLFIYSNVVFLNDNHVFVYVLKKIFTHTHTKSYIISNENVMTNHLLRFQHHQKKRKIYII